MYVGHRSEAVGGEERPPTAGDARILTVPEELTGVAPVALTGNEWVSLPDIDPATGACRSLGVLSEAARALIEFTGEGGGHPAPAASPGPLPAPAPASPPALLVPVVEVGGRPVPLRQGRIVYMGDWIPQWLAVTGNGWILQVTWLAPTGQRGWAVKLRLLLPPGAGFTPGATTVLTHPAPGVPVPEGVRVGLRVRPGTVYRTIYRRRPLPGPHGWFFDPWTRSQVWEVSAGLPVAALALRTAGGEEPVPGPEPGTVTFWSPPGQGDLVVYGGVAPEADGAATTAVHLARVGFPALHAFTLMELHRRDPLGGAAAQGEWPDDTGTGGSDPGGGTAAGEDRPAARGLERLVREGVLAPRLARTLAQRIRQNLWFCLFFAHGRTLDGNRWVHLTSRSPRYYVSGAHWTRDSLLWAFPAVLAADPALARELLVAAFARYTRHPGEHSQYLDGTVLYPGWELDQAAAWPLTLARYLRATGDATILDEPAVRRGLAAALAAAEDQRDPATGLVRTFLLPSDDPAQRPFVTYDNALYAQALAELAGALRELGRTGSPRGSRPGPGAGAAAPAGMAGSGEARRGYRPGASLDPAWLEETAARTRRAVLTHCVVPGPWGPQFAWAVDGPPDPRPVLYDEPPGTLELLGPYGFATPRPGDPVDPGPVYANTVRWIYSAHNPYGPPPGRFSTPTCPHARHPWLLSVAAGLLAGRQEYLRLLAEAPLDSGFACETFDARTGEVRTGPAFATCAGFVAWAALECLRRAAAEAAARAR